MSDTTCSFCDAGEHVIRENAYARLILSNPRKVPGHVLVLPKRHVERPWELTPQELLDVYELIAFAQQRILGKLGDGVDVRQNYRPFKKQDDLKKDHVLFHVIPRSKDDYLYTVSEKFERDLFADLDDMERDEVTGLLAG